MFGRAFLRFFWQRSRTGLYWHHLRCWLGTGGSYAKEMYSSVLERRASTGVTRSLVCAQGWSWLVATAGRCCWAVRDCISQEGDQAILTCVEINVGGASLEQLYLSFTNLWFFQWLKLIYCIQIVKISVLSACSSCRRSQLPLYLYVVCSTPWLRCLPIQAYPPSLLQLEWGSSWTFLVAMHLVC